MIITSVKRISSYPQQLSYEPHEVKYDAVPIESIKEPFAASEGKEYEMRFKNSYPLSKEFIEQHGITTGKCFDCVIKVISKGTCTPILIELPSLDL